MKLYCAYHPGGRKMMGKVPPYAQEDETDGMCSECAIRENLKLDVDTLKEAASVALKCLVGSSHDDSCASPHQYSRSKDCDCGRDAALGLLAAAAKEV